ncbi:MAG: mechanosensitive ion channel family protein [Symploca sp. SIO2B6]|nr:mechanosensitive ion channel family protein [Symploca sp. SIO2B6]
MNLVSWRSRRYSSLRTFVSASLLALILTATKVPQAIGKITIPPAPQETAITSITSNASGGKIVYAPVKLDGQELFQVAAAEASEYRRQPHSLAPIEMRVNMYEDNLYQILRQGFDPKTLQISFETSDSLARVGDNLLRLPNQIKIIASDLQELPEQHIATVTHLDAQIHGLSVQELAQQWKRNITPALIKAQRERQPGYLLRLGFMSGGIFLGTVVASLLLTFWQKRLKAQWQRLKESQVSATDDLLTNQPETLASEETAEEMAEETVEETAATDYPQIAAMEPKMSQERLLNANNLYRGLLQIIHLVVWLVGIAWIFGLFPYTRPIEIWLHTKWVVMAIALGTYLVIKGSAVLIDYCLKKWLEKQALVPTPFQRQALRMVTFSHVLKGLLSFILASIGILWALSMLNIPIAPLLAGAGILSFAISFGSQNLIRDVINGTLILLEDQYAIGDIINVGTAAGVVEEMNLRMTQLRNIDGRLSTVPNSNITTVHNLTKEWSRINFTVEVAHEADINQAIALVGKVSEQMQSDPEWGEQVLHPAEVLGVDNIAHTGIAIVIWIRTQPGQQWAVAREFRRRLKLIFDQQGIAIGVPQQSLWFRNSLDLIRTQHNREDVT